MAEPFLPHFFSKELGFFYFCISALPGCSTRPFRIAETFEWIAIGLKS